MKRKIRKIRLGKNQRELLKHLVVEPLSFTEIATFYFTDYSNATKSINKLMKHGFLNKKIVKYPFGGVRVIYFITKKGKKYLNGNR